MATTTLPAFLRDRRERLPPTSTTRRRTPGLRREEVAARAGVSVTWYTWLEQGRGGTPSDEVLERLATALELDAANREMLFLLAQERPPPRRAGSLVVTPAIRRLLDALALPAFVKTPTFDIVAWNRAATRALRDYAQVPEAERNLLVQVFSPGAEGMVRDLEAARRICLASFRLDLARAGRDADDLIAALAQNPEFARLWAAPDLGSHTGFQKVIIRGGVEIALEATALAIDGSDLALYVFSPVDDASAAALASL